MLIINADDWGRSKEETDITLVCHALGSVTSVSAMVYMKDSERAAEIALSHRVDTGLHLNFSEAFTSPAPPRLRDAQNRIARFLNGSKYRVLFYHPRLRNAFRYVYEAQAEEFHRIYGRPPSRFDGHQHMHLCSNMLLDQILPQGQRVRGTFTFQQGEKGPLNRAYRALVHWWMDGAYIMPDYFFALSDCLRYNRLERVLALAKIANVELMTHPAEAEEYAHLSSENFRQRLGTLTTGSHAQSVQTSRL
ncbi:MAG: ChbG/HpnK family deacetylase [Verrucomicrobia bacterium]|nr:ChbG/HpnK family deacetylase [Verrucomicrobiota bacterium]